MVIKKGKIILLFSLLLFLPIFSFSFISADDGEPYPASLDPININIESLKLGSSSIDLFSGASKFLYALPIPGGTNNLQPRLNFFYNSHNSKQKLGVLGLGWDFNQNYISRDVNYTFSNISDDKFKLTFNGGQYNLIYDPSDDRYHTKIESYFYIENVSGGNNTMGEYWIVKTKDGASYRFGFNNNSELISNISNYVVRWSLDLVNDTHGNSIFYNYLEDPHENDIGTVYLDKIEYNNDKKREINFIYGINPNFLTMYKNGNKIRKAGRLSEITVKENSSLISRFYMNFIKTDINKLSLISNITRYGSDNSTSLPSTSFSYWTIQNSWAEEDSWYLNDMCLEYSAHRLADVNGDGLVDLIDGRDEGAAGCRDEGQLRNIYLNNGTGWAEEDSWYLKDMCLEYDSHRLADVNGDGLIDLIDGRDETYAGGCNPNDDGGRHVYINNGTGWVEDDSWYLDKMCLEDISYMLADVNGDGLIDLIDGEDETYAGGCNPNDDGGRHVYINNGTGWVEDDSWYLDKMCLENSAYRLVDVNDDGLVDLIDGEDETAAGCNLNDDDGRHVYINNGTGWVEDDSWYLNKMCLEYTAHMLADVNGDGLVDLIDGRDEGANYCRDQGELRNIYINNGTGWVEDDSWYLNDMCLEYGSHRLADVNGDGLVDLIDGRDEGANYCRDQGELREIYIHNGTKQYLLKNITNSFGGITVIDYQKSTSFNNTGDDELSDLGFNVWVVANITKSNGIVGEHYTSFVSNYIYSGGVYDYQDEEFRGFNFVEEETNTKKTKYWFHQNDALKGKNYFSRIFGIYYYLGDKNHTIYNDLDSGWTDWGGVGIKFNSSIEQYLYQVERIGVFPEVYLKNSSGSLIASALFEGDIATFENPVLLSEGEEYWLEANTSGYSFSKSLPLELESITIIDENCAGFGPHLCNFEKIIMIYTEENATLSRENLTLEIINDWEYEESQNIYTSFLKENSNILYNSENETKTKNVSYSYDSFGNIIYIYNKGDVENNEDDFFEYKSFLNNSEKWIVDKAKEIKFYASDNSTKLKGNRYYYDKQAYGEAPTKGDLTRVDLWNSQSLNINYEYSYDSYGNLINETDPVKNTIKYYYGIRDTTYTFPDKIEDGEGLVREFEHDLGFGTLSWIKSSNGKYNNYTYDVFGRILSEINVYDDEELPTKVYSYDFDGISPEKVKISDREKNHTEYTFDKYNFYDGFGNLIQTKIEARDNKQIVGNFFYDHLGRLIKKSNPYFETAFINYSTVNGSIPSINFSYDVLNRNTFILNPDGSNKTTVYSLWNILYFDENGNKIEHNLNAYGNIFEILEYNDSENKFETSYTYDDLGRLILIEDSEQNIWNYTYDDLGRLTKEIDPDIGSSNHTYDYAGNLVEEYVGRADLKEDGDYVRQYDDFGNLIIVTIDKENSSRLVELYYYDPEGNRIKTVRHRENVTIYTPFRELMVIVNSSGTFNYTYIYEGDTLVAKVNPDGSKYYYHPDLLGSTTLVTNESGDIFEETFYSPYGLVLEGGEEEIKLYEGKELDSTGQYYYGARYYDPEKRLFIQADQMIPDIYDPQQLNRYSFERNNPYTYTDPSGNSPTLITGAIGYVFGYAAGAISSVIKQLSNKGSVNLLEVGVTAGTWGVAGGVFGLTGSLAYSALGKGVAAGIGAGTFAGSLSGEAELITSSVLNNDFDQLKDPVAHAEAVGYGGLIGGATGGAFGLAGSMAKNSKTVFTSISKSSTLGYLKGGNMPKGVSSSAKNFFGGATGKSNQFNIINSKNSYNFNFFSPARTPGYGKLYTMKTNLKGDVIERIKYTINPKGKAIKTTKY